MCVCVCARGKAKKALVDWKCAKCALRGDGGWKGGGLPFRPTQNQRCLPKESSRSETFHGFHIFSSGGACSVSKNSLNLETMG